MVLFANGLNMILGTKVVVSFFAKKNHITLRASDTTTIVSYSNQ